MCPDVIIKINFSGNKSGLLKIGGDGRIAVTFVYDKHSRVRIAAAGIIDLIAEIKNTGYQNQKDYQKNYNCFFIQHLSRIKLLIHLIPNSPNKIFKVKFQNFVIWLFDLLLGELGN